MQKLVYICAPYRGASDIEIWENIRQAVAYGRMARDKGLCPVIPHINSLAVFGLHGDDSEVVEFDDSLLLGCDLLWICGSRTSPGMLHELRTAKEAGISIEPAPSMKLRGYV